MPEGGGAAPHRGGGSVSGNRHGSRRSYRPFRGRGRVRCDPNADAARGVITCELFIKDEQATERARLMSEQLALLQYECVSCLDTISRAAHVWSCSGCFQVFHLTCVRKWAAQCGDTNTFRCPHCQSQETVPTSYVCFCGKQKNPPVDPHITPHSCGQTCDRQRSVLCPHRCTSRCHPGPCPECQLLVEKKRCPCGATEYSWRCGQRDPMATCDNLCQRQLSCGKHRCTQVCHQGACESCPQMESVLCRCGRAIQQRPCGSPAFDCGVVCEKLQRCGIHTCPLVCHQGECPPCDTDPAVVFTCPCTKTLLTTTRATCQDPIATCGQKCGKLLLCGRHSCEQPCHTGTCRPCDHRELVHCLCGRTQSLVKCAERATLRCEQVCRVKLPCGKHECRVKCCAARRRVGDPQHLCDRPCGRRLPCGHECGERCHRGACPPCINFITDQLFCRCGGEVLMPPQPCSTPAPECNRPCSLPSACPHAPIPHTCHFGSCPPCIRPVERMCAGNHVLKRNVLCSAPSVTCGAKCDKPLPCGHTCNRTCHAGPCVDSGHKCTALCGATVPECGHPCQHPCHAGSAECPRCIFNVERKCPCGLLVHRMTCPKFQKAMAQSTFAAALECNADCLFEQRLKLLASRSEAKPAVKAVAKVPIVYNFFLWERAAADLPMVLSVERHLEHFVSSAETSHSLPPMMAKKRAVVHALAPYYHVRSESLDPEPKRSCLLTKTTSTRMPDTLLSDDVTLPSRDPARLVAAIQKTASDVSRRTITFHRTAGRPHHEFTVAGFLFDLTGHFVIPPTVIEDADIVVYFTTPAKQQEAYGHLRKTGCPLRYTVPVVPLTQVVQRTAPMSGLVAFGNARVGGIGAQSES